MLINSLSFAFPFSSFVYALFYFYQDDMRGRPKAYGTMQGICISKHDITIYLFYVMAT